MLINVINESTLVKDSDVKLMVQAIQKQITSHVLPAWNGKTASIKFATNKNTIPNSTWVVSILDTADVANALGYHDENADQVDAFIFCKPVLDNGGVVLYDKNNPQNFSVSSVLSHEICEMIGDAFVNTYCDNGDTSWALELCDAVEADSYVIKVGAFSTTLVSVSNFLYPSYFDTQATSADMPFDYLRKLSAPFTMSTGGYSIVRKGGPGTETQIFGEVPEWKKQKGDFSRTANRVKKV